MSFGSPSMESYMVGERDLQTLSVFESIYTYKKHSKQ